MHNGKVLELSIDDTINKINLQITLKLQLHYDIINAHKCLVQATSSFFVQL